MTKRLFRTLALVGVGTFFVGLVFVDKTLLTLAIVLVAIGVIWG